MRNISIFVLLLFSIIAAINSNKIGDMAKSNIIFRYIFLLLITIIIVYTGIILSNIFNKYL